MHIEIEMTVYRKDGDVALNIEAEYTPGRKGSWYGDGGAGIDGEAGEVEVIGVYDEAGETFRLTSDEYAKAEELLMEKGDGIVRDGY